MKYLLMITYDEFAWDELSPAEQAPAFASHTRLTEALQAQHKFVSSTRLRPSAGAKTVRKGPGAASGVTDGPFAETKEVMGGFYIIESESIDEATEWATQLPGVVSAAIEVRQIWEDS